MNEKSSFIIATKKIKYLGIYLTRNIPSLYEENYEDCFKRHKGRLEQGKGHPLFLVRMSQRNSWVKYKFSQS